MFFVFTNAPPTRIPVRSTPIPAGESLQNTQDTLAGLKGLLAENQCLCIFLLKPQQMAIILPPLSCATKIIKLGRNAKTSGTVPRTTGTSVPVDYAVKMCPAVHSAAYHGRLASSQLLSVRCLVGIYEPACIAVRIYEDHKIVHMRGNKAYYYISYTVAPNS